MLNYSIGAFMFFLISDLADLRFPCNFKLTENRWLNSDEGWMRLSDNFYFKGYCMESFNYTDLMDDPTPRHFGNFAAIFVQDNNIVITHDRERSFPLYHDIVTNAVGNIGLSQNNKIGSNSLVSILSNGDIIQNFIKIPYSFDNELTIDNAVEIIYEKLIKHFTWLKNNCPVVPKIFFTGGIDTMLCLAMLRNLDIAHDLLVCEHYDLDHFTSKFRYQISQNWGYAQIHHWNNDSWLISGAMGDETFLRGPSAINMILMNRGKNIAELIKNSDYHYQYFNADKNLKIYTEQQNDPKLKIYTKNINHLYKRIVEINLNDYQHWHLGKTITFTPFKDISILTTILSMDNNSLDLQMADAQLQKKLIAKAAPELLKYLMPQKNIDADSSIATVWELYKDLYNGTA